MINDIIEAISVALNAEFGDRYEIYMEEISQDLKEPCFFVQCINQSTSLFVGRQYSPKNQFCIQYFPESASNQNRECYDVAERLDNCLEYICANRPMRGTGRNSKIDGGILNYFVNYDCFARKREDEIERIEDLEAHTTVKE